MLAKADKIGSESMLDPDSFTQSMSNQQIKLLIIQFSANLDVITEHPEKFEDAKTFQSFRVKDVIMHQVSPRVLLTEIIGFETVLPLQASGMKSHKTPLWNNSMSFFGNY